MSVRKRLRISVSQCCAITSHFHVKEVSVPLSFPWKLFVTFTYLRILTWNRFQVQTHRLSNFRWIFCRFTYADFVSSLHSFLANILLKYLASILLLLKFLPLLMYTKLHGKNIRVLLPIPMSHVLPSLSGQCYILINTFPGLLKWYRTVSVIYLTMIKSIQDSCCIPWIPRSCAYIAVSTGSDRIGRFYGSHPFEYFRCRIIPCHGASLVLCFITSLSTLPVA